MYFVKILGLFRSSLLLTIRVVVVITKGSFGVQRSRACISCLDGALAGGMPVVTLNRHHFWTRGLVTMWQRTTCESQTIFFGISDLSLTLSLYFASVQPPAGHEHFYHYSEIQSTEAAKGTILVRLAPLLQLKR